MRHLLPCNAPLYTYAHAHYRRLHSSSSSSSLAILVCLLNSGDGPAAFFFFLNSLSPLFLSHTKHKTRTRVFSLEPVMPYPGCAQSDGRQPLSACTPRTSRPPSRPPSRSSSRLARDGRVRRSPPLVPLSRGPGSLRHLASATASTTASHSRAQPLLSESRAQGDSERAGSPPSVRSGDHKTRRRDDDKGNAQREKRDRHRHDDKPRKRTKTHRANKGESTVGESVAVRPTAPADGDAPASVSAQPQPLGVSRTPPPLPQPPSTHSSMVNCGDTPRLASSACVPGEDSEASCAAVSPVAQRTSDSIVTHASKATDASPASRRLLPHAGRGGLPAQVTVVLCLCLADGDADAVLTDSVPDEVHVPGVWVATTPMGAILTRLDTYMDGFFSVRAPALVKAGHITENTDARAELSPTCATVSPVFFFFPEDNEPSLCEWLSPPVEAAEWTPLTTNSVLSSLFVDAPAPSPGAEVLPVNVELVLRWYEDPTELYDTSSRSSPRESSFRSQKHESRNEREDDEDVHGADRGRTARANFAERGDAQSRRPMFRPILAPPVDTLTGLPCSEDTTPRAASKRPSGPTHTMDTEWGTSASDSSSEEVIDVVVESDDETVFDDGATSEVWPWSCRQRFGVEANEVRMDVVTPY